MVTQRDTVEHILNVADSLMRTRGYNAFSYADIAEQVGIRKASIHYYFPSKSDLAERVCARYRAAAGVALAQIDQDLSNPREKLERYIELVGTGAEEQPPMCLCALLAAEYPTLPDPVRREVSGFLTDQEEWLTRVLADGEAAQVIHLATPASVEAQSLRAGLQGAMLAARARGDCERYNVVARNLLANLVGEH